MKCKNCGGEIRLEEMYCPYCGSPNIEAQQHARDMAHYQSEFEQTKEEVIDKAGRQSRLAVRITATALLLLAIAANIFIQSNSYEIGRMIRSLHSSQTKNEYEQRINSYLDAEDYLGFAAYWSNERIYSSDYLPDSYFGLYRVATNYRYACQEIMRLVNHDKYADMDLAAKHCASYVQEFYESLEPDNYDMQKISSEPAFMQHIENMETSLEAMYITYFSMTPEEAKSMRELSQGNRTLLIERGTEKYRQEAADE